MLYAEFLIGTEKPDNEWTYAEYKRIEAIYNNDNSMSKADAYKMYKDPGELIQGLITDKANYKAASIAAKSLYNSEHEEAEKLRKELGEARVQILRLEQQLRRYESAAHDLYYVTGTI